MSDTFRDSTREAVRRADVAPVDEAAEAWVRRLQEGISPEQEAEFADPIHREELCQAAVEWEVAFWIAREPEAAGDVMCLRPR